jgi:hypothetical protein
MNEEAHVVFENDNFVCTSWFSEEGVQQFSVLDKGTGYLVQNEQSFFRDWVALAYALMEDVS